MTPIEAERLIQEYGATISRGTDGGIARKLSWLPCSRCRLRHAFYVYLAEIIVKNQLTQTIGDNLKGAYMTLNQFIADTDADTINKIHAEIRYGGGQISDDKRATYSKFTNHAFRHDESFEINSYINECFSMRDNQDWILT